MAENIETGNLGEQIAADYLLRSGYEIVGRNLRLGHLEIDIIARREDDLHFFEVKTRRVDSSAASDFQPEAAMTRRKTERIIRAAEQYIGQTDFSGEIFVSLIAVNLSYSGIDVRLYPAVQW